MRTLRLTERRTTECRLSPADVEYLVTEHGTHLSVTPTGRRGLCRLTPAGYVGMIVAPGCRLIIRSKVPAGNLLHLLDPAVPVWVIEGRGGPEEADDLFDFLAGRLAQLLTERAAAGLHRAYVERSGPQPFLQGRLDLAAQLRESDARKDRFHCRHEEFTLDLPCNQIARATAEQVLDSPLLGEKARAALRQALNGFAEVSPVVMGPEPLAADRLPDGYGPLLDLCRLLADGLAGGPGGAGTSCPAFLLDLERVFERYVTRAIQQAIAGRPLYAVRVQPSYPVSQPVPGQLELVMRPDVLVERDGHPILLVDAKWKDLQGAPLVTADVYQVLAYCTALGLRRAMLVYPGRRDQCWEYHLARVPVRLVVRQLRVSGPRERCVRSFQRLGRALHASLRTTSGGLDARRTKGRDLG